MILITVYIASFFLLAHLIEPGAVLERVHFLSGNLFDPEDSESKFLLTSSISIAILATMFLVFSSSLAAFAMVTSEICARVMRPASTIIHPVCSVGFIVNSIPFFSLNFSLVLGIVGQIVSGVFFGFVQPFWLHMSMVVAMILATNKGARKHVATRLRQQIDSFTIGGNNAVHPVVEIPLVPLPDAPIPSGPT